MQICLDTYDLSAFNYKHVHILNALKRRAFLFFFPSPSPGLAAKVKNEGRKQFQLKLNQNMFFHVPCPPKIIIANHSFMPEHLGFSSFGEKERKWVRRFWEVLGRSRMSAFPFYPKVQWLHDVCELPPTFFSIYSVKSCPRTIF